MAKSQITAGEALKAFRTKPSVQVATRITVKDKTTGKEKPAFDVKNVQLSAEHVTGAARYDDGRVVVTTIDGMRHEARAGAGEARE